MKGAFLLANSWGESWYDGGRCWVAYDALNTESEYEDFKFPNALKNKGLKRGWTLDQFCFIYWDRDIVAGLPSLCGSGSGTEEPGFPDYGADENRSEWAHFVHYSLHL